MKTFEEWWEEFKEVHDEWRFANSGALRKAAWNAAIETMRQDCEPVAWMQISVEEGVNEQFPRKNKPPKFNADWWKFEPLYTHPQPLRELSREEVIELWNGVERENGPFAPMSCADLERFAKLVREAK